MGADEHLWQLMANFLAVNGKHVRSKTAVRFARRERRLNGNGEVIDSKDWIGRLNAGCRS